MQGHAEQLSKGRKKFITTILQTFIFPSVQYAAENFIVWYDPCSWNPMATGGKFLQPNFHILAELSYVQISFISCPDPAEPPCIERSRMITRKKKPPCKKRLLFPHKNPATVWGDSKGSANWRFLVVRNESMDTGNIG